ncbi:PREDICTED: zinc finger CCCH domain-containing protein 14, partial [Elephantulus edwardii]|uniref:zinc finger CCCH domain-containing protein 14 n=1 Tax=Elephantulus edwardii TaxID=28737 RepID=UPI0003F0E2D7
MEIGTEISRKIRSAIKGKLQELGAYVDEELPDYIMVMVANKKSQDQMTEDLSLFLGNNTIRFTVWLHGVLDKLRSVTTEPSSLKSSDTSIFDSSVQLNKGSFTGRLCEPEVLNSLEKTYSPFFRSSSEKMSIEEENFRKRKLPVVSSVIKVKKFNRDGEEEEEDEDYGSRTGSVSSSVSVPAKPERRPSLPPSKQANKNLILKAISEAQESVTKTTNYSTVPQKQTLPVAPRTRTSQEELLAEVVQGQSRSPRISTPIKEDETKGDTLEKSQGPQQRQLLYRLQIDPVMAETLQMSQDYYDMESMVHADTRSFILKKPKLSEEIVVAPNHESGMKTADTLRVLSGHLVQTRDLVQPDKPASPKFIVTLDGVPSPPGYMSDQEEDMCFEGMKPVNQTAASSKGLRGLLHPQQWQLTSRQLEDPNGSFSNVEISELTVAQKPEKLLERCKYWPACKNGDECAYHHPVSPCKAFPNCKFAEKCLFVHPNCKYDAKCTKPDCPFTHLSRRIPVLPPKPVTPAASPSNTQLCRYFPACKKMECPFYHPKHCRFNTQCTRPDCAFYHPTITVPPRHALKW